MNCIALFYFFLWLHSIIVNLYHNFFIFFSLIWHLCCFHILAVVLRTSVNIGAHIFFQVNIFVIWGQIPISGKSGSNVISILNSLGGILLFAGKTGPDDIPTRSERGFFFLPYPHKYLLFSLFLDTPFSLQWAEKAH